MIEIGPLKSENQVKKSQFRVTSPLLPRLRRMGVTQIKLFDPYFCDLIMTCVHIKKEVRFFNVT